MTGWETLPGKTPLDDISGLLVSGITTRAQLNKIEAENIRKPLVKYLAAKPTRAARFDLPWLLQLHNEMFCDVWEWAGKVRTKETNIGVMPQDIEISLTSLLADLEFWNEHDNDLIKQAVMLHHKAVLIHPFLKW